MKLFWQVKIKTSYEIVTTSTVTAYYISRHNFLLFLLEIDLCSEWYEHQIIEQVKNDVMIEENASSLVNLSCLLMNQTSCLNECTTKYKKESISLPLSSLHVLWVEVSFLKVRKPKFSWSGLVAIRSTQYYFHTQMENTLSGL